jgi:hypothetical protein
VGLHVPRELVRSLEGLAAASLVAAKRPIAAVYADCAPGSSVWQPHAGQRGRPDALCLRRLEDSAKEAVQPGSGHLNGLSPVCVPVRVCHWVSSIRTTGRARTHMDGEGRGEGEGLAAFGARVGPLSGVRPMVLGERRRLGKRLAADRARKGLIPCAI